MRRNDYFHEYFNSLRPSDAYCVGTLAIIWSNAVVEYC